MCDRQSIRTHGNTEDRVVISNPKYERARSDVKVGCDLL